MTPVGLDQGSAVGGGPGHGLTGRLSAGADDEVLDQRKLLAGRIEERADTAAAAPVSGVAACKKLGCLRVIASPSTSMLGNRRSSAESGAVAAAAARTRHELGPVTILVNNAGISVYESFTDITEDSWDRMIRINLKGPFLVTRELVSDRLRAGWGRIVNISSSAAQTGAPAVGHYAASKGGVIGLTKALAGGRTSPTSPPRRPVT